MNNLSDISIRIVIQNSQRKASFPVKRYSSPCFYSRRSLSHTRHYWCGFSYDSAVIDAKLSKTVVCYTAAQGL